jgi:UDP-N-acetyl-D-galactosamine dehydrogenase
MSTLAASRIGIIGLGYVGLPLAVEFGRHFDTLGFDIDARRIEDLRGGVDRSLEVEPERLRESQHLTFTTEPQALVNRNVYIVTVPTPIDRYKRPDLTPLEKASETVSRVLSRGDLVIYESTVYPGATEEVCVPILEAGSGLVYNQDFFCGYSPERINPGDQEHRVTSIKKVTSGSTPEAAERVDALYRSIITAGTHLASSIRVAEAAKVIENTQRDVNIALINELAILFHKMGIPTLEVLEAAGSKWNFLPFRPGLVGGHCIGVDPYYLTHKAQEIGYHPEIILAGRRINDRMGEYVAQRVVRLMTRRGLPVGGSRALILGLTFKENCPDIRNTRVLDIVAELAGHRVEVDIHDPWASAGEVHHEYGIELVEPQAGAYDAVIVAVGHRQFKVMSAETIRGFAKPGGILFDVKSILPPGMADDAL